MSLDYTPEEMDLWAEQEIERREYQQLLAEQASDERDAALEEAWQREAWEETERFDRSLWATR
jgi:hypothetical protein